MHRRQEVLQPTLQGQTTFGLVHLPERLPLLAPVPGSALGSDATTCLLHREAVKDETSGQLRLGRFCCIDSHICGVHFSRRAPATSWDLWVKPWTLTPGESQTKVSIPGAAGRTY